MPSTKSLVKLVSMCFMSLSVIVACSSGGVADEVGGGSDGTAVPASVDGGDATVGGGPASTVGDTAAVRSPEAFAEYYRKLGVAEPVIACYVEALGELGVVSLDQLEADQALGVQAAEQFDRCVADVGARGVTDVSTP